MSGVITRRRFIKHVAFGTGLLAWPFNIKSETKHYLIVGAGTVMSPNIAQEAVEGGAQFLVSPVCNVDVIQEAEKLDVVSIPGTFTATEMETAHRAGADFVKLFPAPENVAEYIRFILAPLPYLKIFPTSGVNLDNMLDVLQAGAAGIGFVRPLFDPEMIRNKNYGGIRQRAEAIVERLASL